MKNEKWTILKRFPDYSISSCGRILKMGSCKYLKTHQQKDGLHYANLVDCNGKTRHIAVVELLSEARFEKKAKQVAARQALLDFMTDLESDSYKEEESLFDAYDIGGAY